jgi:uncharacterized protein (DUF169 family)
MSVFNKYGKRIEEKIRPKSYPLAIKMIKDKLDIPAEAKRPTKDFGVCMATCQCFSLSRRFGETVAQLFEDMWCPEPVIGFGLAKPPKYFLDGYNRHPEGVETLEAGANWAAEFPRFPVDEYMGILSAPLTTASFEPDVGVIYCDSAQLLKLLLSIAYKDGHDIRTVLGGHAACVYAVVPSMLKGQCQVAVPCRGDRGRAGAQDDEMIFAVPKDQIGRLVNGLHQSEVGSVPTRFSMKHEYNLSESYAKIARLMGMKKADGSEIKGVNAQERRLSLEYK